MSAVGYIRVSTTRQAKHAISLEEQERQIRAFAAGQSQNIIEIYAERGATGTNDRRPELQRMMRDAKHPERKFDTVLIWNFSRFFRDDFDFERYRRELANLGIALISVTQQVAEGPSGSLTRRLTTVVDAYQSEVNAEAVRMAMSANAKLGFWNGSRPPFGYKTEIAQRMGKKDKKKLVVNEAEAEIVRLIFDLYLEREGNIGNSGVIAIAKELNRRHIKIREKSFLTSTVHDILHRKTYAGTHFYNQKDSRTGKPRPKEEWISVDVPQIISEDDFQLVQAKLARNNPKVTAPRTANSPTLTAGLSKCGEPGCGAGMILRTGKGGQYRYLVCGRKRTISVDACPAKPVRMEDIDEIVLSVLEKRVLAPARLRALLGAVLDRSDEAAKDRKQRLSARKAEKTNVEAERSRLMKMVATGLVQPDDKQLIEMVKGYDSRLEAVKVEIRTLEKHLASPTRKITDDILARFSKLVRDGLRKEDTQFRRAYLRLMVDEVVVHGDGVTIRGSKNALEHAVFAGLDAKTGVLTSIQGWRARQDSNLRPRA